jgi:hypothetical protein
MHTAPEVQHPTQPDPQSDGLQVPAWQNIPASQLVQAWPPTPQNWELSPVTQLSPEQQPIGQVAMLHNAVPTQPPSTQISTPVQTLQGLPPEPHAEPIVPG